MTGTGTDLLSSIEGSWVSRAKCRDSDPDIFHDRGENHQRAKWVCERLCPVKLECRAEAERVKHTFEYAQTWGGVLYPRAKRPDGKGKPVSATQAKHPVKCSACGRMVGVANRHYSKHRTMYDGPWCTASGTRHTDVLSAGEVKVMYRIQAGETRSQLRPARFYTDKLKRDKLIQANEHRRYDITTEGMKALRATEENGQHGTDHEDPDA